MIFESPFFTLGQLLHSVISSWSSRAPTFDSFSIGIASHMARYGIASHLARYCLLGPLRPLLDLHRLTTQQGTPNRLTTQQGTTNRV